MKICLVTLLAGLVLAAPGIAAAQGAEPVGDPVNGKTVFTFGNTSCTNCHGVDGIGGWGPDLAGKNISYAQALRAIRNPIWRMPSFAPSQLTNQEIADMTAYWKSLKPVTTLPEWREKMVGGEAPLGQQLAVNVFGCGQCHGATLETPRHGAAEVNGDFEWFKRMVYNHSVVQPEQWKELDASAPMPPTRRRVRMGNFTPKRIPEETMRVMWDWMVDIGILVPVQARLTTGATDTRGTTYNLDVTNVAVPNKGLVAEDATISVIVPAGMTVVSATGDGYQGVKKDMKQNADVASWHVSKIAPRDQQKYTITLSGAAAGDAVPKGHIGSTGNPAGICRQVFITFT